MKISHHLRRRLAQMVPFIYGNLCFVVVYLPVIVFYSLPSTLQSIPLMGTAGWVNDPFVKTEFLWALSAIIGLVGAFIPSCLPLFECERDRRFYERLGISQFRRFANGGEVIGKVTAAIDPESMKHSNPSRQFNLSTLSFHKSWYDLGERVHWFILVGTMPAIVWAWLLGQYAFALLFCITNLFINVYPIMLERYMRARVEAIERHPRYKADFKTS